MCVCGLIAVVAGLGAAPVSGDAETEVGADTEDRDIGDGRGDAERGEDAGMETVGVGTETGTPDKDENNCNS